MFSVVQEDRALSAPLSSAAVLRDKALERQARAAQDAAGGVVGRLAGAQAEVAGLEGALAGLRARITALETELRGRDNTVGIRGCVLEQEIDGIQGWHKAWRQGFRWLGMVLNADWVIPVERASAHSQLVDFAAACTHRSVGSATRWPPRASQRRRGMPGARQPLLRRGARRARWPRSAHAWWRWSPSWGRRAATRIAWREHWTQHAPWRPRYLALPCVMLDCVPRLADKCLLLACVGMICRFHALRKVAVA
jgi:hypothetical protein